MSAGSGITVPIGLFCAALAERFGQRPLSDGRLRTGRLRVSLVDSDLDGNAVYGKLVRVEMGGRAIEFTPDSARSIAKMLEEYAAKAEHGD